MCADRRIDELRDRDPGSDPEDPYADIDLDELPAWWRDAIAEFAAHGLRPYRPPRFRDGTPVYEVVDRLESGFDVRIDFGATGEKYREAWAIRVDGKDLAMVDRHRSVDGYTVYEIDPGEFEELVRNACT